MGFAGRYQRLSNDIISLKYRVVDVEVFRQTRVNVAAFKADKIFLMTDQMTRKVRPTNVSNVIVIVRLGIPSSGFSQPIDFLIG